MVNEEDNKGFRKGVTKESLMKSMTKDDWLRVDKMKEAETRSANEDAYKLFVLTDQAVTQKDFHAANARKACLDLMGAVRNRTKLQVQLLSGDIKEKDSNGFVYTAFDLEIDITNYENKIIQLTSLLRTALAGLYTYTGTHGLDRNEKVFKGNIIYTEDDYNGFIQEIKDKLSKAKLNLY
jgi:hypothetical protein